MRARIFVWLNPLVLLAALLGADAALGVEDMEIAGGGGRPITLVVRNAPVAEVFEMLSRHEQVNILLAKEVEGEVTVNLFDESLDRTVRAVAEAAGYLAERRREGYVILPKGEAGKDAADGNTVIRTMRVHYSDPKIVSEILQKHLSRYGEITVLEDRGMMVVEDLPDFVDRLETLVAELDHQPQQLLIEAKILEISLEESDLWGIDWTRTFEAFDGVGDVSVVGLASAAKPGLIFDLVTPDMTVILTALSEDGRVRTLSTPTLLTVENEPAEVVIGDRLGFRVVTTVNEVTSESVEFLESGVILKIEASVDRDGRIMLDVHPEVSTGVIDDGLPNQTTTEVTTKLIAEDGQPVFIGGLIKDRSTNDTRGVPFLKDIPVLGWLFTRREDFGLRTETVVLITAHALEAGRMRLSKDRTRWVPGVGAELERRRRRLERAFDAEPDSLWLERETPEDVAPDPPDEPAGSEPPARAPSAGEDLAEASPSPRP